MCLSKNIINSKLHILLKRYKIYFLLTITVDSRKNKILTSYLYTGVIVKTLEIYEFSI